MSRVFFFSSHICVGKSGGGHGVIFRLYNADKKYELFQMPVIYVFKDMVIEGYNEVSEVKEQKDIPKQSPFRVKLKKYIPSIFRIAKMEKTIKDLSQYLHDLDRRYRFTADDIYICHDFRIAYAFVNKYSYKNVAFVFHMQGSIYFEWHAETGISSEIMRKYYNRIFTTIVKKIKYLCFPSVGTEESLVSSEPALESSIKNTKRKYLYNGVDCPTILQEDMPVWIKEIEQYKGYKFVTVANLNEAKAIERIPQYLDRLSKAGVAFKWILVGNGVKASEVEQEIGKYHLSNHVLWKQTSVQHDELMKLFSVTDFYIMFHKYSIFDLSTLEAMHYGNIPILTPVGGNKEMIIDGNGLFVSDFTDVGSLLDLISHADVAAIKRKNINIQNNMFNDKAFLKRYVELCENF